MIFGDTDAMGVVYYGTYMRFLEIGRVELLRARGKAYSEIEQAGYLMPVAEVNLRYLAPARYDDVIDIAARVDEVRAASVKFEYELRRGETLLAFGFTRHACWDRVNERVARLPDDLAEMLAPKA